MLEIASRNLGSVLSQLRSGPAHHPVRAAGLEARKRPPGRPAPGRGVRIGAALVGPKARPLSRSPGRPGRMPRVVVANPRGGGADEF